MELLNKILEVAAKEPKSIEHLLLKLMEEVGEASQAYLSLNNVSGSKYKSNSKSDFQEELIDSLLVLITLINKTGISKDELEVLIEKKITKWQKFQEK